MPENRIKTGDIMENTKKLYAGFWKRAAAAFIDGFILSILYIPAKFVFGAIYETAGLNLLSVMNIFTTIIAMVYMCGMESSAFQATPGKLLIGIKVTDTSLKRITVLQALLRRFWLPLFLFLFLANVTVGFYLSIFLLYFIGCSIAAFTGKKQALHDFVGQTYVVNASYFEKGNKPPQKEYAIPAGGEYDKNGMTPLMLAVYNEDIDGAGKILKENKDAVNKINPATGASALWMAAAYGNAELIKLLLANGADVNNTNHEGLSIIEIAHKMGHADAARLLADYTPES